MAHKEQIEFCEYIKKVFPKYFTNKTVLDVGSANVNGTNQYLFTNCKYTGIDVLPAENVNVVGIAHLVLSMDNKKYHTAISTEALEHDCYYPLTLLAMHKSLVKGGLMVITCAGLGRPEHGTHKTGSVDLSQSCLLFNDYYYNLDKQNIIDVFGGIDAMGQKFLRYDFLYNGKSKDLYFYGIKR